jgi:glycosyltransferase involved in cell wall biosynthesis
LCGGEFPGAFLGAAACISLLPWGDVSINPDLYPSIAPPPEGMARPFWSVIVPAYKPAYLGQALRSVLDQDPGPDQMEIIVIDDCSPSQLEPIVRGVAGNRVQYVRQTINRGTFGTQNHGLALSRGQWIHILNDDDWVLKGFYSTLQSALKTQPMTVGAACCMYSLVGPDGGHRGNPELIRNTPGIIEHWIHTLGVRGVLQPVAVVVRRSTHEHLGGFHEGLRYTSDWEFYKRAAIFYDWWYEPRTLACYREHGNNCTSDAVFSGEQISEIARAIRMTEPLLPGDIRAGVTAAAAQFTAIYAIRRAEVFFRLGMQLEAIRQLQAGLRVSDAPAVLDRLLALMAQPEGQALKQLLPQFMQMVKVQT